MIVAFSKMVMFHFFSCPDMWLPFWATEQRNFEGHSSFQNAKAADRDDAVKSVHKVPGVAFQGLAHQIDRRFERWLALSIMTPHNSNKLSPRYRSKRYTSIRFCFS